jgi:hypothetical protein
MMIPSPFDYILLGIVFGSLILSLLKIRPFYTYVGRILIDIGFILYGGLTDHHVVMAIFIVSVINSATKRPEFQAHRAARSS